MRIIVALIICIFIVSCKSQEKKSVQKDKNINKTIINLPKYSVVKSIDGNLLKEIKFVRNEIFARYGREFKNQEYISYFSKFDWYKTSPNYNDSILTDNDLRDIKVLINYEDSLLYLNNKEINTIKNAVNLMKQFRYTTIDTTIYSTGYINSDDIIDTANTTIKLINNKISIIYSWVKDDSLIWEYMFIDPYLWVSDSKLFEYGTRDIWVTLAIAAEKCIFEFKNKYDFEFITEESGAYIAHLYEKSIIEKQFLNYIKNSIKQVVIYSQDESGGNLDFWYEPLNKFVPYYRP